MPFAAVNGVRMYYRLEGTSGKPMLVLSHSIGLDHGQWAPQMADFLEYFQVLLYDTRGHGASEATPGDYSMEQLAQDVVGLADALKIGKFVFCGLSLGGMIGQRLGVLVPQRLTALVLANTSPLSKPAPPAPSWNERRRTALEKGLAPMLEATMQRCFTPETLALDGPYVGSAKAMFLASDPAGYAGSCAAIRDMDHTALLHKITTPTLVIVGDRDASNPWAGHGELLAREIPGAQSVRLSAAHWSNLDQPRSFTATVLEFALEQRDAIRKSPGKSTGDPKEAGFAVRRAVLGDAHVDRSIAATTDFNREFQDLITRYAWGTVWTRPGLDRRTRRLLVLAMTASLGRWEEFRLHVRSALEHGMEPSDMKELLLQAAIYAGAPVGNTGFHIAIEEIGKQHPESQAKKSEANRA